MFTLGQSSREEPGGIQREKQISSPLPPPSPLLHFRFIVRIEEELGEEARFAGHNFRNPSVL